MEIGTEIEIYHKTKTEINRFENEDLFIKFLDYNNLPSKDIFVSLEHRKNVIDGFESAIQDLKIELRETSFYLSKFIAAVANGLFDAALNYLWDETIKCLRQKIYNFDVDYFIDNIDISDENKKEARKDLSSITDQKLIDGLIKLEYITKIGYRKLLFIKEMRNWASAAHPNHNDITGFDLLSWLQICITEVINSDINRITIKISEFLKNIKNQLLDDLSIREITNLIYDTSISQLDNLITSLHSIYTSADVTNIAKTNIQKISKSIWNSSSNNAKNMIGIKYSEFLMRADTLRAKSSKEFLSIVDGMSFLPEEIRTAHIDEVLDQLYSANCSPIDNFYNEPPIARNLKKIIDTKEVPKQVKRKYVTILITAFITNGKGVCWDADKIYLSLIKVLTPDEAKLAISSSQNDLIEYRLESSDLCRKKYIELLNILKDKIIGEKTISIVDKLISADDQVHLKLKETQIKDFIKSIDT